MASFLSTALSSPSLPTMPRIFHTSLALLTLILSPLNQAAQQFALKRQISEEAAKREVAVVLDKLMASFNSRVARSFEYVMTKVLKRLFASIHLDDQGIKMVNSPILMKR